MRAFAHAETARGLVYQRKSSIMTSSTRYRRRCALRLQAANTRQSGSRTIALVDSATEEMSDISGRRAECDPCQYQKRRMAGAASA